MVIEGIPGAAFVIEVSAITTVFGSASAYFTRSRLTRDHRRRMDIGLNVYRWTASGFLLAWLAQLVLVLSQ